MQSVGAVYDSVEDRIGQSGIWYPVVPVFDGQLAGEDSGPLLVSVVENLKQIALSGKLHGARPQSFSTSCRRSFDLRLVPFAEPEGTGWSSPALRASILLVQGKWESLHGAVSVI